MIFFGRISFAALLLFVLAACGGGGGGGGSPPDPATLATTTMSPLFGSFALDRAVWLARQPLLLFNTLIFPIILVVSATWGVGEMRAKGS